MAKHCPGCGYRSAIEWDDYCPRCGRLLPADAHPDPWYNRRVRVQKVVQVIMVGFVVVMILALSLRLWQNLP